MYKKDVTPSLWFFLFISCLGFLLLSGRPDISSKEREGDPMEQREEKLKTIREKRNLFFKEDLRSPLKESERKTFKGLLYYPIDLRYAMIGSIERYPIDPRPIYAHLPTSKETEKKYVKYGRFKFGWTGKEYALQIYRPLGGGEPFLPFKDKTSEADTYPKGRYLFIEIMPGGKVLVDFNRAYNPFCEYNEKYTCTFAPEENWLGIAIRAGEKRFH
jgi:hypothetical protein